MTSTSELEVLLATRLVGMAPDVVRALVVSAAGMNRAELLRRVAPDGDWPALTPLAVRVLGVLLDGEQWTKPALMRALDVEPSQDRKVRDAVERLRHAGFPILSRSNREDQGYRLTDDPDEIEEFIQREVTPRAMRQHELEAAMRRAQQRCRASRDEGVEHPAQPRLFEDVA